MSDLVKFYELERAELEDVAALQTLTLEYAQRVLGSLVGGDGLETMGGGGGRSSGGLVTLPSYTYDSNAGTITLSSFSYLETFRGGAAHSGYSSTNIEARIARYDSSAPWSGSVDVSAVTIINPSSLWARARRQSGDAQARRQWDTALSAEVPVTLETRELQQVELVVSVNRPEDSAAGEEELGQWVKIGDLSAALANPAIRIKWVSIWDTVRSWLQSPTPHAGSDEAQIALNAKSGLSEYADSGILPEIGGTRGLGLRDHLKMIRGQLQRVINQGASDTDQDTTKNWLSAPVLSLRNIAARLGVVETGLSDEITARESGDSAINNTLATSPQILGCFSIQYRRLGAPDAQTGFDIEQTYTAGAGVSVVDRVSFPSNLPVQQQSLSLFRVVFDGSLDGKYLTHMSASLDLGGLDSSSSLWTGLSVLNTGLNPAQSAIMASVQPYMGNDGSGQTYGAQSAPPVMGVQLNAAGIVAKLDLFSDLDGTQTFKHRNQTAFAPNIPSAGWPDNQFFTVNVTVWGF
jgi:hypothetical protein